MTVVLETQGIEKSFGGTLALRNVDFSLEEGEIHTLLGENGAGKSTLSKILAGVLTPDRGEIRLRGTPVHIASPTHAQALGIGMVFQELDLFPHLNVAENLAVANAAADEGFTVKRRPLYVWCAPFLEQVGLDIDPSRPLHSLSVSQRQLVAIARALSMRARIILMDEPTSSLSQLNVEALFAVLGRLKRDGVSIVYVSHKIEEVRRISDRITVLRDGLRIATENAREVFIEQLITLMVGRPLDPARRTKRTLGKVLLDVRTLTTDYISNIQFQVRAGEVLGIAGLVGAGRSEIGAALFGLRRRRQIDVFLGDRPFAPKSVAEAIERGFCLLPEDRREEALFLHLSVLQNATIAVLRRLACRGWLINQRETSVAGALFASLKLASAKYDVPIDTLSGGNQQKAIMARWLMAEPRILFLDEPTRGIDIGTKTQIYQLIDELADRGAGILVVSSEMSELMCCCDRIIVMHEGTQAGIVDAGTTTQEQLLTLATGDISRRSQDFKGAMTPPDVGP